MDIRVMSIDDYDDLYALWLSCSLLQPLCVCADTPEMNLSCGECGIEGRLTWEARRAASLLII